MHQILLAIVSCLHTYTELILAKKMQQLYLGNHYFTDIIIVLQLLKKILCSLNFATTRKLMLHIDHGDNSGQHSPVGRT